MDMDLGIWKFTEVHLKDMNTRTIMWNNMHICDMCFWIINTGCADSRLNVFELNGIKFCRHFKICEIKYIVPIVTHFI